MSDFELILVDHPADGVARITLNRPEKRNAISTPLRAELLAALEAHDFDDDVRVTVIRGAGDCFSAGYDLSSDLLAGPPFHSAPGDGSWARQVTQNWFAYWDLAKPVVAQVHGYAIAGATELAQACDLVYVADDARIAYPIVRVASPPDWQYHMPLLGVRRAMEIMLTGEDMTGAEAAAVGWANRAFPASTLEEEVLDDRGAHRRGGERPGPDQQAARTPPSRDHGRARRDSSGRRVPGPRWSPGFGPGVQGRPARHDETAERGRCRPSKEADRCGAHVTRRAMSRNACLRPRFPPVPESQAGRLPPASRARRPLKGVERPCRLRLECPIRQTPGWPGGTTWALSITMLADTRRP